MRAGSNQPPWPFTRRALTGHMVAQSMWCTRMVFPMLARHPRCPEAPPGRASLPRRAPLWQVAPARMLARVPRPAATGLVLAALTLAGCRKPAARENPDAAPAPVASTEASLADASPEATTEAGGEGGPRGATAACPDDMVHVDTSFCPDVERHCLDMEHEEKNNLEICHAFAPQTRCRTAERRLDVCIDRYEYPNEKGAHPVWMLDWYQAQATCESKGKRLCMASEWTAACEGPEHTPFPYGWERDHDKCNMDNFYIDPRKPGPKAQFFFYSKDPEVAFKELSRLDQSVPSGSMETCKSGFGVYDLPGNFDEWVGQRRAAAREGDVGRAQGRRLGARAQPVPAHDVQPRARVHLLLRRLPLLPRRRGRAARGEVDAVAGGRASAAGRAARLRARLPSSPSIRPGRRRRSSRARGTRNKSRQPGFATSRRYRRNITTRQGSSIPNASRKKSAAVCVVETYCST